MTDKRVKYLIEPTDKKSVYEEQTWTNKLKNGKAVTIKVCNLYRWGEFHITVNEKEKSDLLTKETILLNDYEDYKLQYKCDRGYDFWLDIVDEDIYSDDELNEINILIYKSTGSNDDDDDKLYEYYDEAKMRRNGWDEIECEYALNAPFELKLIENE